MMPQQKAEWVGRTVVSAIPYIGICVSEDQLKREVKRLNASGDVQWCSKTGARTNFFISKNDDKSICIVCMNKTYEGYTMQEVQGLLVHEAVHVWQHVLVMMGEESPGIEIEAYAIQQIYINLSCGYDKLTAVKP